MFRKMNRSYVHLVGFRLRFLIEFERYELVIAARNVENRKMETYTRIDTVRMRFQLNQ